MKAAVIVFPGSNCDRDMAVAFEQASGQPPEMVWHKETRLPAGVDVVALPGGFSYGDYLRCGAIAAQSPVMRAVIEHARRGGYVLGVCNGFQVLTETGLLPGVLMRNSRLDFICRDVPLVIAESQSIFTRGYGTGQQITLPVAHHEGNYLTDEATLNRLESEGRVALRYLEDINGSMRDIAGVLSENRRVLGLMPHPERMIEEALGGTDGLPMIRAFVEAA